MNEIHNLDVDVNNNKVMKVIDATLLDKVSEEAKESPRLKERTGSLT